MLEILKDKRIGVLMGGTSAEREVSLTSGNAVTKALKDAGYDAHPIIFDGPVVIEEIRKVAPDVIFIALHGRVGEDGTVQGLLEIMGIPYTGSGVTGSAVAMDKAITKRILKCHGIPTAEFITLDKSQAGGSHIAGDTVGYPLVVKPSTLGSTIGMSFVYNERNLGPAIALAFEHDEEVVLESFIEGREITAGVLDGKPLPLVEVIVPGGVYDYQAKYSSSDNKYICPAELDNSGTERLQAIAVEVYHALKGRGAARVDFRMDRRGNVYVLEMNTIPGMTPTSLLPKAAAAAGIAFTELVENILAGAINSR